MLCHTAYTTSYYGSYCYAVLSYALANHHLTKSAAEERSPRGHLGREWVMRNSTVHLYNPNRIRHALQICRTAAEVLLGGETDIDNRWLVVCDKTLLLGCRSARKQTESGRR